ncbi:MAG: hypothetical protein V4616_11035, partial [Bacteroidota bacterium]
MPSSLFPTIDLMTALYEKPVSRERFDEYLDTLQGDSKNDLQVPVAGFNPMAQAHAVAKLNELKELQ